MEAERDPEAHGWLADALRVQKKGHAAARMGEGQMLVPHGPGGGFLLHSHVIHEDDSPDVKNAYARHIAEKHGG